MSALPDLTYDVLVCIPIRMKAIKLIYSWYCLSFVNKLALKFKQCLSLRLSARPSTFLLLVLCKPVRFPALPAKST